MNFLIFNHKGEISMNTKRAWISIWVITLVFTLAFTFTKVSATGDAVAFANAWSIDLGAGSWDVYGSGSAYAAATAHGPGNAGTLTVGAYAYMSGGSVTHIFANGGGHSISASGEFNFAASSSGSGIVTSMLGSASDSASS